MSDDERFPHGVDVHVGTRLRSVRKTRGLSQADLANSLGLTFQQVQKYERGANRISASRLYEAAATLKVPVGSFFDGLPDPASPTRDAGLEGMRAVQAFLQTAEGLELATAMVRLKPEVRRQVLALVRAMLAGERASEESVSLPIQKP